MSTLSFKKLNKIYPNNVQAVFDFNLEIKDKEFIVFVGPSGCGKSTTLRMVAGLEDITSGELYIDNVLVNAVEPKDRNISMVFQNYALYPHMTVYGNMAFALKLRKVACPIYLDNPEVLPIRAENFNLLKQIKKLNHQAKKQHEPKEIFEKIDSLYGEIFANEDKIKAMLTQQEGIYEEKIVEISKKVLRTEKELAKYETQLAKGGFTPEATQMIEEGIEQKKNQIAEMNKTLEHLKNNNVPLFKSRKLTKYEINLEIYKAARILDLTKYLYRKPAALSGGQRQRVALGRAIVRNPKVFLMDEPLSNLDAKLRVQTRSEIIKIHKRVQATTIYVTHDQTEAMTMADRIVVMKDGYIQQIGAPEEIYADPVNVFVAGFIGNPAMNFFNVKFDGKNLVLLKTEDGKDEVTVKLNAKQKELLKKYENKELVLGIRPEALKTLDDAKLEKDHQTVELVCDFRELLGYEIVVYSNLAGQKVLVKVDSNNAIKAGDKIKVGFNNDALYFFDKETTKRIK